jgi:hypothetical protein
LIASFSESLLSFRRPGDLDKAGGLVGDHHDCLELLQRNEEIEGGEAERRGYPRYRRDGPGDTPRAALFAVKLRLPGGAGCPIGGKIDRGCFRFLDGRFRVVHVHLKYLLLQVRKLYLISGAQFTIAVYDANRLSDGKAPVLGQLHRFIRVFWEAVLEK